MTLSGVRSSFFGVLFSLSSVAGITLVSVDQEIAVGKQADKQVRQQTPQVKDAQVVQYVRNVAQRLVRAASGPRYPYTFTVADSRDINAFALPGGSIWINRGVLEKAANESQVAGVLAHEIAHLSERHAARQLTTASMAKWSLNLLGALLGNSGGAGSAQVAAEFLASSAFLKFNRDEERDADRVGLTLMTRAGWDGRGMVELFEILRKEAGRNPTTVEAFFSSHPSPQDRITDLQAAVRTHREGRRDSRDFQVIRARLLKTATLTEA